MELVIRSIAKASDYTEDINRHKSSEDRAFFHTDFSWIKDVFDPSDQVTPNDYIEWLDNLCKNCLNNNPSDSLKTLQNFGPIEENEVHFVVFNPAFYSIWKEPVEYVDDGYPPPPQSHPTHDIGDQRENIIKGLSKVIQNNQVPDSVHSVFLDLANFIEHCDVDKEKLETQGESLNAFGGWDGIKSLGDCAEKISAYQKAIHYREMEFQKSQNENKTRIAESLISNYSKLNVQEAAEGVLYYAQDCVFSFFHMLNRTKRSYDFRRTAP